MGRRDWNSGSVDRAGSDGCRLQPWCLTAYISRLCCHLCCTKSTIGEHRKLPLPNTQGTPIPAPNPLVPSYPRTYQLVPDSPSATAQRDTRTLVAHMECQLTFTEVRYGRDPHHSVATGSAAYHSRQHAAACGVCSSMCISLIAPPTPNPAPLKHKHQTAERHPDPNPSPPHPMLPLGGK